MRANRFHAWPGEAVRAALAALVASSGCLSGPLSQGNAANPQLERKVFPISCDDGRRYAARALKVRNYAITSVDRSGSETVVAGRNTPESTSSRITVQCVADGVTIVPSSGSQWVIDGLRFTYYQLVEAGDRIWPPPTGPVVQMDLVKGPEAKIEFPTELEPLGLVAVRVRVLNAGERTLRIDPRRIRIVGEGGRQALAMAAADVERKLAAADPDIKSKLLKPSTLKKGERVVGFVFFPAGAYDGASLALIDDKTGEADDYDASFRASS
ncbi:MAG: hypothetical protein ACREQQ_19140 [Candidatus Binatia bacterium]